VVKEWKQSGRTYAAQWCPLDESGPYGAKGSSAYPLPRKHADGDGPSPPPFNPWPQTINGVTVIHPSQLTVPWDGKSPVNR
jgi:hypothetical protein